MVGGGGGGVIFLGGLRITREVERVVVREGVVLLVLVVEF